MDFWRTVLVLFRRWYITIPAFFATLGLAAAAYSVVPVQYESVEVLVLTTPLTGGTESTQPSHPNPITNPLMNFEQSLALTGSIVIQQLNSSESARALGVTPGGTTTYLVTNGSTNPELLQSGPFIFIQGSAASSEAARDIADSASAMAADVLAQRQTELNAPPATHISLQVVVPATAGQPLKSSRLRAAAAVGALAGLASLAAVYGFESLMVHRRRRRVEKVLEQRRTEANDGPSTTGPDAHDSAAVGVSRGSTDLDLVRPDHVAHEGASVARHRVNGAVPARGAVGVSVLEDSAGDDGPGGRRARNPGTEDS